jgi:hypothetical protein
MPNFALNRTEAGNNAAQGQYICKSLPVLADRDQQKG